MEKVDVVVDWNVLGHVRLQLTLGLWLDHTLSI